MSSHPAEIRTLSDFFQENRFILNQIRHIQSIGNKLISLTTKYSKPDNIGDIVMSTLISDWHDSFFSNYEKMAKSTICGALFLRSLLPPSTKIPRPRIYFRLETTEIDNQYYFISEHVQMDHQLLKELTSLYHIHQWIQSGAPLIKSWINNFYQYSYFLFVTF